MSFRTTLAHRAAQLRRIANNADQILAEAQEAAAKQALQVTMDATPPKAGTGRLAGTNTLTGALKSKWKTDSQIEPVKKGRDLVSELVNKAQNPSNDMYYASFVENGHRMDRHFVPGLYINERTGLLEYDMDSEKGIVVGTKTRWVKGEFMAEKGKREYERALVSILTQKIEEALNSDV